MKAMTLPERQKAYDNFAGFLDTYRANNLAQLEHSLGGKLYEMSSRLKTLESTLNDMPNPGPRIAAEVSGIQQTLSNPQKNVIEKLGECGRSLLDMTVSHAGFLLENNALALADFKRLLYLFVTAAEASNSTPLVDLAVQLGASFRASATGRPVRRSPTGVTSS